MSEAEASGTVITGFYTDTETGGFNPKEHALLQISAAAFRMTAKGYAISPYDFNVLVNPPPNLSVTFSALKINGLKPWSEEFQRDAIPEADALEQLVAWSEARTKEQGVEKARWWAQNAAFDSDFLHQMGRRVDAAKYKDIFPARPTFGDSRQLAQQLRAVGRLDVKSTSLDYLWTHFGLEAAEHVGGARKAEHDALQDVRGGIAVLWHLFKIAGWL